MMPSSGLAQNFKAKSLVTNSNSVSQAVYLDKPAHPHNVHLKIVEVLLHGPKETMTGYAILDDGSERAMILFSAV